MLSLNARVVIYSASPSTMGELVCKCCSSIKLTAHSHWSSMNQALFTMLAGVMLARISPSGCSVVCTLTYAMSVAMYLSTQEAPQNI